jgi:hypothetical protein
MTSVYSDYGTTISENSSGSFVDFGAIIKITPPGIKNKGIEYASPNSGWMLKIPSGLVVGDNLKGDFAFSASDYAKAFGFCISGSSIGFKIALPNGKNMTWNGNIESFAPSSVETKSPSLQAASLEISVSGSIVLA